MKKISLWLNVILIVAVAGIYAIYFMGNGAGSVTKDVENTEGTEAIDRDFAIAYVEIDSLISRYQSFIDKKDELTKKKNESEAELQLKSKGFEKEVRDFQNQVNKGLITRTKAQMLQQELAQKEKELYATRDNMLMQLSEEEQVMYRRVLNEVMEYLEEYTKAHHYKYVLSNSFGGQILYSNKNLDITEEVLSGINENYIKEKNK